jgi:competence ComEA-like helix-hairpin-helix protein
MAAADTKPRDRSIMDAPTERGGSAEHPIDQAHATRVNLNTASEAELRRITNQMGVERAQSIIKYREAFGPLKSVEEVADIPGFGLKLMKFIRAFSYVGDNDKVTPVT